MKKQTVLITGASSGIGKATAQRFLAAGWNVAATMRQPGAAADHPGLTLLPLDVTSPASIEAAIADAERLLGPLDVVVNNAGYGLVGPFEAATDEQIRRQFETNVFGLMNVVRAVLPGMRARRSGVIINVASMGGRITFPLYSLYHGTKWAVEGFSESLQYELEPFGIRVKIIEPGAIKTDFYDRSMDVITKAGLTAYDAFVQRAMPNMQRAGATAPGPEVVADAIFTAATDHSPRLRYSAATKGILALRRLLPDRLFMSVVRSAVLR